MAEILPATYVLRLRKKANAETVALAGIVQFQTSPIINTKGVIMTKLDFISLCGELLIDPDVVLSDDNVEQMLIDRADDELREYLKNEF